MNRDEWTRASRSVFEGQCVEAMATGDEVRLRDSQDPDGPVLHFSPGAWIEFIDGIKTTKDE